jgi:aryl-alcohol dehydrogenase-like predicted oxidoreductase
MKYNYLGNSGLKVSELCYGVMTFTGNISNEIGSVSQTEANELTLVAIDKGINFFDTADVYTNGISEIMLGKALGAKRNSVIVGTKARFPMSKQVNDTGLSRHHIIESCNQSLKRLNTDYIDLYQLHSFDPGTPMEETLRALEHLIQSGKVRYIGCSNFTAWQTMKAINISEKLHIEKFITSQLYYSLGNRDIESEIVPMCSDQKLGILAWSPLSGGFFSGKYRSGQSLPADSRLSHTEALSKKYWPVDETKGFQTLEILFELEKKYNKTVAQLAINWLLSKKQVCSVIIGARKISQLMENTGATGWQLLEEDILQLDNASAGPIMYPMWHQKYSDER